MLTFEVAFPDNLFVDGKIFQEESKYNQSKQKIAIEF